MQKLSAIDEAMQKELPEDENEQQALFGEKKHRWSKDADDLDDPTGKAALKIIFDDGLDCGLSVWRHVVDSDKPETLKVCNGMDVTDHAKTTKPFARDYYMMYGDQFPRAFMAPFDVCFSYDKDNNKWQVYNGSKHDMMIFPVPADALGLDCIEPSVGHHFAFPFAPQARWKPDTDALRRLLPSRCTSHVEHKDTIVLLTSMQEPTPLRGASFILNGNSVPTLSKPEHGLPDRNVLWLSISLPTAVKKEPTSAGACTAKHAKVTHTGLECVKRLTSVTGKHATVAEAAVKREA